MQDRDSSGPQAPSLAPAGRDTVQRLAQWVSARVARLPYDVLQRRGRSLGWLLGHIIRHRRRVVLDQIAASLPEHSPAEWRRIANEMYAHLGTTLLECLYLAGDPGRMGVPVLPPRGLDRVEEACARGKGALILMGHVGNWEFTGLAARSLHRRLNVVVKPLGHPGIDRWWREVRERSGLHLLPRQDAMRDCIRALRRNEVVALILDQNMRRERGIFVDFFGRAACTTPGLAYLSAVSGCPVLPAYVIRDAEGRHQLNVLPAIDPPLDRSDDSIHAATQAYTRVMESIIREHPSQWTWVHKRWKTRPE